MVIIPGFAGLSGEVLIKGALLLSSVSFSVRACRCLTVRNFFFDALCIHSEIHAV